MFNLNNVYLSFYRANCWWSLLPMLLLMGACQSGKIPAGSQMVWSDEFNYNGPPNPQKWTYSVGGSGWGNQELQFYTKEQSKNARVEGGMLIIEAHKEDWEANQYTSAKLTTEGKASWTYGRIEVRAKLPKGTGSWPAIWMLPDKPNLQWPDDGEIDIMEHVGHDPGVVHGTVHTRAYFHSIGTQKGGQKSVPDFHEAFHVYSIEWSPEKIEWFIDGKKFFTFANDGKKDFKTWPFDKDFYLILNIAVGGTWGGQKGVDDAAFPMRMEIDWVRVYQNNPR